MEWTQEEINGLYAKVQKKAVVDEEFREELLADANAVIEKVAGQKLPEGYKIKVIENDAAYAQTFVLPDMIVEDLNIDELGEIAGGCGVDACAANVCGANAGISLK